MERRQKQITGRAPVSYSWDDGQYSRARYQTRDQSAFRVENVSAARKHSRKQSRNDRIRLIALEIATVAILVLMLSMVIGKLNRITDIRQEQKALDKVIDMLKSEKSVLSTMYKNLSDDASVVFLAKTKLNMIDPDDTSIHVLSNVKRITSDVIHTAEAGVKP